MAGSRRDQMSGAPRKKWTGGRIGALVGGLALGVAGLSLLLVGGTVMGQANGGGIDLGQGEYDSQGHALVSEPLDWSSESYLGGSFEQVGFEVSAADGSAPLIVGLAEPEEAEGYLTGEPETVETSNRFDYTEYVGGEAAQNPGEADLWTAQAEGAGEATLEFSAPEQQGERVLVIMNADGEPLAGGEVSSHGEVPSATAISVGLLVGGGVAVVGAVFLVVLPIKRARR